MRRVMELAVALAQARIATQREGGSRADEGKVIHISVSGRREYWVPAMVSKLHTTLLWADAYVQSRGSRTRESKCSPEPQPRPDAPERTNLGVTER
jgi:hypothetical protein